MICGCVLGVVICFVDGRVFVREKKRGCKKDSCLLGYIVIVVMW